MSLKYERILIAIDGSEAAEKAFKKAVEVAKESDSTLVLVHVVDIKAYPIAAAYGRTVEKHARESAEELLEKYEDKAEDMGVNKVEKVIEYGSPRALIAKTIAPKEKVDLIIVGATGLGMVERFIIGSVSESTVRHARCDVLIVR